MLYIPLNLLYKSHLRQENCWSFRCSWSIACRRCSNYIFTLDLKPGFNGLGKNNCKTIRETLKFWDLVQLILEVWRLCSKILDLAAHTSLKKPPWWENAPNHNLSIFPLIFVSLSPISLLDKIYLCSSLKCKCGNFISITWLYRYNTWAS